jgi:hypothetical protein
MNGRTANLLATVSLVVTMMGNTVAAASPSSEIDVIRMAPSSASLVRFYPTALASSPLGAIEDQDVWLAKVRGLVAGAPPLLQQSLLATRALGDFDNLVYKALAPCRIMDTRSATAGSGVQGPIAGGSLKQIPGFITAGQNWSVYGQPAPLSDCGLTNAVGTNIRAVALVVTILNPNFSAFLGISDSSVLATVLSNVALNYTGGQGLSTMYIVRQNVNTIYFAMPPALSAHLIFDVVGYYTRADATALDCVWTAQSTVNLPAGTSGPASSVACDAGYTMTGGTCYLSTADATLVDSGSGTFFDPNVWYCYGRAGALASSITSFGRCCRIPGK